MLDFYPDTTADGRIIPSQIPGKDLLPDNVNAAADTLSSTAKNIRTDATDVETNWQVLPAVFVAPSADVMYGAMRPAVRSTNTLAGKLDKVASALYDYATNIATLKKEFETIRTDAESFRTEIDNGVWVIPSETKKYEWRVPDGGGSTGGSGTGGEGGIVDPIASQVKALQAAGETVRRTGGIIEITVDWKESSEHVDRNNKLLDRVADQYAKLSAFEAECANTINAQRDTVVDRVEAVKAWQLKQDGENTVDLPWGHRVQESRNCGEGVWHGVGTGARDGLHGLGGLVVGYNPQSGDWWQGESYGNAWGGLATGVGSLLLVTQPASYIPALIPGGFQDLWKGAAQNTIGMAKGMVGWDQWADNPAEAAGTTIFNVATIFIPGPKGLSAILRGTTIGSKLDGIIVGAETKTGDLAGKLPEFFTPPKFDFPDEAPVAGKTPGLDVAEPVAVGHLPETPGASLAPAAPHTPGPVASHPTGGPGPHYESPVPARPTEPDTPAPVDRPADTPPGQPGGTHPTDTAPQAPSERPGADDGTRPLPDSDPPSPDSGGPTDSNPGGHGGPGGNSGSGDGPSDGDGNGSGDRGNDDGDWGAEPERPDLVPDTSNPGGREHPIQPVLGDSSGGPGKWDESPRTDTSPGMGYQIDKSGIAPSDNAKVIEYFVESPETGKPVAFDNFTHRGDPPPVEVYQEFKGNYSFITEPWFPDTRRTAILKEMAVQAKRQWDTMKGTGGLLEWYFKDPEVAELAQIAFDKAGIGGSVSIHVSA
ncbi:hypothetical protein [Klugiella xanthotipulae]|uniref:Restriction endonuclease fold toxin 5 of polymorphic toxin system n=2 Tax=Klugiella xanthotipulae TaxID=244735 RepID=A0A543I5U4_9MICO|nr:hypothetical protein [Klugiella xanthotipulae]TQM65976.1 restriction endonuclease fold toxin 5 of polymorphic toxin system [Klugiella xanthotipulae]